MLEISDYCKSVHEDEGVSVSKKETKEITLKDNDDTIIEDNPLYNELVLDVIFDNLPTKDRKSARLVNKTWHSTLQPRWREQMEYRLVFGTDDGVVKVQTLEKDGEFVKLKAFTAKFLEQQHPENNPNDPLQTGRYPIRNFAVIGTHNILFEPDQSRFWELYGQWLKRIDLNSVRIHKKGLLKRLLFELTPCLEEFFYFKCVCDDMDEADLNIVTEYTPPTTIQKNLKCFDLTTVNTFDDQREALECKRRFPISWMEFFSVFPNIQKLALDINHLIINSPRNVLQLFQAIDIIRRANNNQVLNITELSTDEAGFGHVNLVENHFLFASLPISTLDMNTCCMNNNEIIALVQSLKLTLRDLTLEDPGERAMFLPNDALPQGLTKLCLSGWGQLFSSFEFLSYTPNLEELHIGDITAMLQPEVCTNLAAVPPLVKLKKLTYMLTDSAPPEEMDFLAMLMPNVTICDCSVDPMGFRALCRGWNNIEHLKVFCKAFWDDTDRNLANFFMENFNILKCSKSLEINYIKIGVLSLDRL